MLCHSLVQVKPRDQVQHGTVPSGRAGERGADDPAGVLTGQRGQGVAVRVGDNDAKLGCLQHLYVIGGIAKRQRMARRKGVGQRGHLVGFGAPVGKGQKPSSFTGMDTVIVQGVDKCAAQLGAARPDAGFGKGPLCRVGGVIMRQAGDLCDLRHGHIAEPAKRVAQLRRQAVERLAQAHVTVRFGRVGAVGR